MADIQQLTYPFFTDGTTPLNASNLNQIVAKINELVVKVNGGVTPTQTVATPTISISGTTATISCETSGATIYYTTNGNTPTTSSTQYSSPITLSGACTIKAIAVKSGMTNSAVASQPYSPASPVVYKNYATTTVDDQVVFIANSAESILSGVEALYVDDYKVEISAYLTSTAFNSPTLWGTSVMKAGTLGVNSDVVRAGINTTDNPTDIASEAEAVKAYQLGVNTKTGDAHVNEQTHTCTLYSGHYAMAKAVLFGKITSAGAVSSGSSRTGVWKIASAKIYNATSNALVAEIVPATYNGTPCLYDKLTDTPLYPNTGTLAVE